ncbi:MAG: DnaJ domain-containing protein [Pseudomonadota bacterium]|nr:DnaJ domain-containing protein [Pseudomonadota bacterium]
MPQLIAGLFALYLLLMAIRAFGRITPASAAKIVRGGGYALGFAALALLLLRGSFGLVGVLASLLLGNAVRGGGNPFASMMGAAGWGKAKPRVSTARSAAIEMRLDRDSGRMSGVVTAGPFAGRTLEAMTRTDCVEVYRYCLSDDPEGAALLEAYLDRRFPAWREAEQGEGDARPRGWSGGALSRDEAYEILGLAKGAGREEIVAAHRSLMKKLHPDHGGSTALAARVNQAKDVLLD